MSVLTELLRIDQPTRPSIDLLLPVQPRPWADHLASAVSTIFSPPLLAAAMIAMAAAASRLGFAWLWAGLALALSMLAPIGYLIWLRKRGVVSDLDVQRREERFRPLVFTVASLALTVAILWLNSAPALLRGLAAASFVQTTIILAITVRWKISMHGAGHRRLCGAAVQRGRPARGPRAPRCPDGRLVARPFASPYACPNDRRSRSRWLGNLGPIGLDLDGLKTLPGGIRNEHPSHQ